jgi:glucose/arabinose dehydrogenase
MGGTRDRRHLRIAALVAAPLLLNCGGGGDGAPNDPCKGPCTPGGIAIVDAFPNLSFDQPLFFAQAPGDTTRAFVATQQGIVYVFANRADVAAAGVFLDIDARVTDAGGELGFLGFAFDPAYSSNGRFYVNYNPNFDDSGTHPRRTQVSRFQATSDPAIADAGSETPLLTFEQPFDNHNGGWLDFGPDGKLYIATGDGGSAGDPDNNAQNVDVPLGKILRINADGSAPADNPFVGIGGRDDIWALGLRNPYRASFDRATGELIAADVGQSQREEVDVIVRGGNYGWRKFEGTLTYNAADPTPADAIAPLYEYDHSVNRCTIIGGYVYRGAAMPAYAGRYFFADFCTGELWTLSRSGGAVTVDPVGQVPGNPTSFGEDAGGELYVTSFDGHVYKLVPG